MFIRRAKTGSGKKGGYHTYHLVQSVRDWNRVRKRTLLNLGTHRFSRCCKFLENTAPRYNGRFSKPFEDLFTLFVN